MAVSTVPRPVTPAMRRSADQLLAHADRWAQGTRHADGMRFYTFVASKTSVLYFTSVSGCTCPGYRNRGVCCHSVAVSEHERAGRQVAGLEHVGTSSPTSWRHCSQKCGALLPPEHQTKMCDPCWERISRLLEVD